MANEWLGGSIGKSSHESKQKWGSSSSKDKYFDGNNLRAGYETRYLGNGDNVSQQGAIAVYTNDYDDMWDSYDPMRDKSNYGIFKVTSPKSAPAPAPTPTPKPKPKPVEKKIEPGTFKVSPEIQQAKDRVKSYEAGESPWEQAQANVQSSFIKPSTSSNSNQQYDFSADSFNANESPEPNEQAQAAQNQLQNYVSKYSQYKSSAN